MVMKKMLAAMSCRIQPSKLSEPRDYLAAMASPYLMSNRGVRDKIMGID